MVNGFLEAIFGSRGAQVMRPLQDSGFSSWLPARAALAWVGATSNHSGFLPGTTIPMVLAKTDFGWTGAISDYAFVDASASHVAAAMTVYLDSPPGRPVLKPIDLSRLGRTVDALIKAEKSKGAGGGDASGTGIHAAAIPPTPATPATAMAPKMTGQKKTKSRIPKIPKTAKPKKAVTTVMKLSEVEAGRACPVCGSKQIVDSKFKGCFCFRSMAKSVQTERINTGIKLVLKNWDDDALMTLRESLGI
jgi:hypothetical protein